MQNIVRKKLLVAVYDKAVTYLQNTVESNKFLKNECNLENYFEPVKRSQSMETVADQLFVSLQTRTMAGNVIG